MIRAVALAVTLTAAAVGVPASAQDAAPGAGLTVVASFANVVDDRWVMDRGGTDMAYDGRYLYAAEQGAKGGVHIIDTASARPRKVGFFPCGGIQNDVAVVRRGLLAIGYHNRDLGCGSPDGGITLIDVTNPRKPRLLGSTAGVIPAGTDPKAELLGVHTMTVYPGTSYIYASPGGRQADSRSGQAIVDVSDPRRPEVVATTETGVGCHDFAFDIRPGRALGFCTGPTQTQVWDVADPVAPKVVGVIVNPLHDFHHSAAVSDDGKYVVIGTETLANDCVGGPTGGLFIYDITVPAAPVVAGYFGPQRGAEDVYSYPTDLTFDELCAPHLFNFIPGTRTLVSGNGSGGLNVVDWTDPARPHEVAFHQPPDRDYWAAYWFGGRIYANGIQALDVLTLRPDPRRSNVRRGTRPASTTPPPPRSTLAPEQPRYWCAVSPPRET